MPGESIKFVADVSEVRQALDRVVSDAARMRVAIPVGSAPGAAGAIAAGFPPTVSGIFGSSFTDVYGRFGAGVGPLFDGGQSAPLGGNFNSFPATGGFSGRPSFNYSPGGLPTVGGTLGTPTPAGGPPGGFSDPGARDSGSFNGGFATRGFGRFVGAGYLAHIGFSEAEAARQNNIDNMLAGNDQAGQLDATMKYRRGVIAAGGWIGQAVGFLQDPTGSAEAGIKLQTESAEAEDRRTAAMSRATTFRDRLSDAADASGIEDPSAKRLDAEEKRHKQSLENIEKERATLSKANREALDAQKKLMEAGRSDEALRNLGVFHTNDAQDAEVDRLRIRDEAVLATMREQMNSADTRALQDANRANEARLHRNVLDNISRDEARGDSARGFSLSQAILADTSEMRAAGMEAAGNTLGAARERITSRARARLAAANRDAFGPVSTVNAVLASLGATAEDAALDGGNARDVDNAVSDSRARRDISLLRAGNDPLGARIREMRLRRDEAIRSPLGLFSANYRAAVEDEFQQSANDARVEDADARLARSKAISARGRVLSAGLGEGRFAGLLQRSAEIREDAIAGAEAARRDPRRNPADIANALRNGQVEEQLLRESLTANFRPGEVSRTNLQGGASGSTSRSDRVLEAIEKNTKAIADELAKQNGGGAASQFGVR